MAHSENSMRLWQPGLLWCPRIVNTPCSKNLRWTSLLSTTTASGFFGSRHATASGRRALHVRMDSGISFKTSASSADASSRKKMRTKFWSSYDSAKEMIFFLYSSILKFIGDSKRRMNFDSAFLNLFWSGFDFSREYIWIY